MLKIKINNQNTDLNIKISDNVPAGEAYISYDYSYYCKYNYCINNIINLNVENIYYSENIDLKITKTYTKYNFNTITGFSNYEENNGYIYISREDYNKLYNKDYYQSSVFVTNVKIILFKGLKKKNIHANNGREESITTNRTFQ